MKAGSFRYERAATLAEVFRLRGDAGVDAKLLAGGQTLLATLAFRLSEPQPDRHLAGGGARAASPPAGMCGSAR